MRLGSVGPLVTSKEIGTGEVTSNTAARDTVRLVPIGPCAMSVNVSAGRDEVDDGVGQVASVDLHEVGPCRTTNPSVCHLFTMSRCEATPGSFHSA